MGSAIHCFKSSGRTLDPLDDTYSSGHNGGSKVNQYENITDEQLEVNRGNAPRSGEPAVTSLPADDESELPLYMNVNNAIVSPESPTPGQLNYIEVEFPDDRPQVKRPAQDKQTDYTEVVKDNGKIVLVSDGDSPTSS